VLAQVHATSKCGHAKAVSPVTPGALPPDYEEASAQALDSLLPAHHAEESS
jgi:hypothetical protein